jgi:hypothetical protein
MQHIPSLEHPSGPRCKPELLCVPSRTVRRLGRRRGPFWQPKEDTAIPIHLTFMSLCQAYGSAKWLALSLRDSLTSLHWLRRTSRPSALKPWHSPFGPWALKQFYGDTREVSVRNIRSIDPSDAKTPSTRTGA